MMLTDTPFLRHRMLGPTFVGVAAIAKQLEDAIGRRRQGGQEILPQPTDEQMHVPRGRCEQTAKAPRGEGGWRPLGHLFPRFSPRGHGWHKEQPAEEEAMATAPHGGHTAKHHGHKTREVGEGHHQAWCHLQREYREHSGRWNPYFVFPSFSVDLQGLDSLGCQF